MDKFVTKSPQSSAKKSFKRKGYDYDKQYDAKKRKRNFQMSWLTELPWLALDADLGIMKCKICCKWANLFDPKSPLVMGRDKFRKDLLYAHAKSAHHAACVMRNDHSNKPIKDTPIGKAVVRFQQEQHYKLKGLCTCRNFIHPQILRKSNNSGSI